MPLNGCIWRILNELPSSKNAHVLMYIPLFGAGEFAQPALKSKPFSFLSRFFLVVLRFAYTGFFVFFLRNQVGINSLLLR